MHKADLTGTVAEAVTPGLGNGSDISGQVAAEFAAGVLAWFDRHGRKSLPWQQNATPYRVWVSEIMLQQTRVQTVIPYYRRFLNRFPTVQDLAASSEDEVLHLWTGLGYYARARNLHAAARRVCSEHAGQFPADVEALQGLPGVGRSTAGAIAALSMGLQAPILDGNAKRVLTRCFAIAGWPGQTRVRTRLWRLAEQLTPQRQVAAYTQAMMDLGAAVCTRTDPDCDCCPLSDRCRARALGQIDQFPAKKPGKVLPTKSVAMFILQDRTGCVLLEKRPASGIWGSLYSLPEGHPEDECAFLMNRRFSLDRAHRLAPIRHTFSHYQLQIIPLKLPARVRPSPPGNNGRWLWYPLDHSRAVGLAAPVKKLLSTLA